MCNGGRSCLGLGPQLPQELTPAHPCSPAEEPKGVNDEMSERHLGASKDTHQ